MVFSCFLWEFVLKFLVLSFLTSVDDDNLFDLAKKIGKEFSRIRENRTYY